MFHKIYNLLTWIKYRGLHRPIRMKVRSDYHKHNAKITAIFLHGISADVGTWQLTLDTFKDLDELQDMRMISVELLGFGRSLHADWLDYSYADYNAALTETIKHLNIDTPIILVAHSMGALIAAHYAASGSLEGQISNLILVSPPVFMGTELARFPDRFYTRSYDELQEFYERTPALEVIGGILQKYSSFRNHYIKTVAFQKSMEQIILSHQNYTMLTRIHIPTLLLHGHFDPMVMGSNLRKAAERNKCVTFRSVIGAHDISAGKRVKILAELKRIMKNVEKAAAEQGGSDGSADSRAKDGVKNVLKVPECKCAQEQDNLKEEK